MAGFSNVLLVSFSIGWGASNQEEAEYDAIYKALQEAIKAGLEGSDWWSENTSVYVIRTAETPSGFLGRVWRAAKMRSTHDRLLVMDTDGTGGVAFGAFQDKTLFSLVPGIVQVPAAQK